MIDQSNRLASGFELDDQHAVLDEIDRIGAGGNFFSAPSTLKGYKTGYYPSPVFPRWSMEKWQGAGRPTADQILGIYTAELILKSPAPDDHAELKAKGEEFIAAFVPCSPHRPGQQRGDPRHPSSDPQDRP